MYKVYRIISPSGRVYVGITRRTDIRRRWENGKGYRTCQAIYNAINKYGWNNLKHEILFEDLTKERACRLEKDLIRHYKNLGISYNISDGGECELNGVRPHYRCGWHHSAETRKKISESNKGKKCPYKGQKRPPEVGLKVSVTKKGIATRGYGWHHSAETRKKISESNKGHVISDEARAKMSAAKKGKPSHCVGLKRTEETKKLQSELKKQYYAAHKTIWMYKIIDGQIVRTRQCESKMNTYLNDGWHLGKR